MYNIIRVKEKGVRETVLADKKNDNKKRTKKISVLLSVVMTERCHH